MEKPALLQSSPLTQIRIGTVIDDTQSSHCGQGQDGEGHSKLTFFYYTVGRNGVVLVFEGLGGGGWLGGGSDEGEGGVEKSKRWGRNTTPLPSFAGDGGLRTLSEQFRAIKMFYRMNVYDSNAETEGHK